MFGIGSGELFLIVVVAVLVLGPEHLPRIMRTTQKVMSTFRKVTTEFQRTLNLEDVLNENDGRATTKRQAPTTQKKKTKSTTPKRNHPPQRIRMTWTLPPRQRKERRPPPPLKSLRPLHKKGLRKMPPRPQKRLLLLICLRMFQRPLRMSLLQ